MDKIIIKGLRLKAYHGVNPEEKENGQTFELDITAYADLDSAKKTDNLEDTVNYAAMVKTVRAVFTSVSYDLIEKAAYETGRAIISNFPKVEKVTVLLKKPEAPMKADFDYVAVEETFTRDSFSGDESL